MTLPLPPFYRRMEMKRLPLLLLAGALLAFGGCKSIGPFFERPEVTFDHVQIDKVSLFESTLIFTFRVHNPNPMGVNIESITYELGIENSHLAEGTLSQGFKLPASETQNVAIPVKFDHQKIFQLIPGLLNREAVAYTLSGKFRIMGFNLPFKTGGNLAMPKIPRVTVESVEVTDITPSGAGLEFVLDMENPNSFPVNPDSIQYAISLGGVQFVSGEAQSVPGAAAKSDIRLRVPATIDFEGMSRSALNLLGSQTADYEISGNMKFNVPGKGPAAIPFTQAGEVPLAR